jgi:hypothetical protein
MPTAHVYMGRVITGDWSHSLRVILGSKEGEGNNYANNSGLDFRGGNEPECDAVNGV